MSKSESYCKTLRIVRRQLLRISKEHGNDIAEKEQWEKDLLEVVKDIEYHHPGARWNIGEKEGE